MRIRELVLGAMLCLLIVNQASAQCLCAAKGLDYCSCKAAVRPVPKVMERLVTAKFPPIGDSCYCGKQLVEPAVPPKPVCKAAVAKDCKCKCCAKADPPPPPCFDVLGPPKKVPIGIPADPISISLALRAGKAFAVPEAKLSYGPAKPPLNALKKIYFSRIPEENLYALNSEIIEFKRPIPKREEIIAEEELEEEEAVPLPPPYLTYQQLGYGPAVFRNPLFIRCSNYARPGVAVAKRKLDDSCGYKAGKIVHNANLIEEPYVYGDDCL